MASGWSATDVVYRNDTYVPDSSTDWVRFVLLNGEGQTVGLGGSTKFVRDLGFITVQIFVPERTGTAAAMGYVDAFNTLFEHERFDGIETFTASVTPAGVSDGWHQTNVNIPFRRTRNV